MDFLDMPISMFFPSELPASAAAASSAVSASAAMVSYPQHLLGFDSSQDELLLMHHHQQEQHQQRQVQLRQLQQLQQHHEHQRQQQRQLQYGMAQIDLETPPTSPPHPTLTATRLFKQNTVTPHNQSRQPDPSIPYQHTLHRHGSFPSLQIQESSSQQQPPAQSHSYPHATPLSLSTESPYAAAFGGHDSDEADLFPLDQSMTMVYDASSSTSIPISTSSSMSSSCAMACNINIANVNSIDPNTAHSKSPTIPYNIVKREISSPITPTAIIVPVTDMTDLYTCSGKGPHHHHQHHQHQQSISSTSSSSSGPASVLNGSPGVAYNVLSVSPPSCYPAIGDHGDSAVSAFSSPSSSDRANSQECEPRLSVSPLMPALLQDLSSPMSAFTSSYAQANANAIAGRTRPRSMVVTSSTLSSSSAASTSIASMSMMSSPFSASQPYMSSPYHKDSMSVPASPTGTMSLSSSPSRPRLDRRRSTSSSFVYDHHHHHRSERVSLSSSSASFPSSPSSLSLPLYEHGAGHQNYHNLPLFPPPQQQQQQQQHDHHQYLHQQQHQQPHRSPVQYSPQQHHFQHLLDPSMVPEITDIHVCPVCQRRFTRPFNLRSHIMTHTTARPYPCDECHWKFTRQHDLLRHKRAKHPGSVPSLPPKTTTATTATSSSTSSSMAPKKVIKIEE